MLIASHQLPSQPPPFRLSSSAGSNSRLDNSWGTVTGHLPTSRLFRKISSAEPSDETSGLIKSPTIHSINRLSFLASDPIDWMSRISASILSRLRDVLTVLSETRASSA